MPAASGGVTAAASSAIGGEASETGGRLGGERAGGPVGDETSGKAVRLELEGHSGEGPASEAAPGLAAVASSDAASTSNGVSREAAASRKPDGGLTRSERASGEAARLELEGGGDGETAPEAVSGLAVAVSSDAASTSNGASREEASGGVCGERLEQEPSGAKAASGATSDFAAAAATAETPASVDRSRDSAGWPVDTAADGGATYGTVSGGVVQLEVKGDGGKAAAPKAVPGLAAAAAPDAASTSNGASREAPASCRSDGGSTGGEGASGEAARLELEGDGDEETAPEAASGLAAAVSLAATTAPSDVSREAAASSRPDGDSTGSGEASSEADVGKLEVKGAGGKAAASKAVPGLAAATAAAASPSDKQMSRETAGSRPGGGTADDGASGEAGDDGGDEVARAEVDPRAASCTPSRVAAAADTAASPGDKQMSRETAGSRPGGGTADDGASGGAGDDGGEELEREPGEAEVASGATSDFAHPL